MNILKGQGYFQIISDDDPLSILMNFYLIIFSFTALSLAMTSSSYRKLSVEFFSLPMISFSIHLGLRLVKIIKLSSFLSIILPASIFSSINCTGVNSPSKTEFCIHIKYRRQSLSIFPTLFSPQSYTAITYIGNE